MGENRNDVNQHSEVQNAAKKKAVKQNLATQKGTVATQEEIATTQEKETGVQRRYKDTMFRILFREKKNLLSLYNAVNRTAYTDTGQLKVTTLENAICMNYKNDISFVFSFELMPYEHQSTYNPNMPLRNLIYVSKVIQGLVKDEDLYGSKLIRIPAPRFAVFYNGTESQPESRIMKLSEAFQKEQIQPELELAVTVYNINPGQNMELMEACRLLKEYGQYVEQVRKFAKGRPLREAVEAAVDYCIINNILADFLSRNRAEAIEVSIFEYDEEKHLKNERMIAFEEGREDGLREGHEKGREDGLREGIEKGENRLTQLLQLLIASGRDADMNRAVSDLQYREKLYQEHHL